MQQALDALIQPHPHIRTSFTDAKKYREKIDQAIAALEQELAKPDFTFTDEGNKQEPVAQIRIKNGYWIDTTQSQVNHLPDGLHDLYTAPPRKEWVGLTDKEILDLWVANHKNTGATDAFACAVEAKLKEKNT